MFNQLLCKLRNSRVARADYHRVADLLKKANFTPTAFLPEWEEWRIPVDRYRMGRLRARDTLAAAVAVLAAAGLPNPMESASLVSAAIEQIIASADFHTASRDIWRIARLAASTAASAGHLVLVPASTNASAFQRAAKRHQQELSRHDPLVSQRTHSLICPRITRRWGRRLGFVTSANPIFRHRGWKDPPMAAPMPTCLGRSAALARP